MKQSPRKRQPNNHLDHHQPPTSPTSSSPIEIPHFKWLLSLPRPTTFLWALATARLLQSFILVLKRNRLTPRIFGCTKSLPVNSLLLLQDEYLIAASVILATISLFWSRHTYASKTTIVKVRLSTLAHRTRNPPTASIAHARPRFCTPPQLQALAHRTRNPAFMVSRDPHL